MQNDNYIPKVGDKCLVYLEKFNKWSTPVKVVGHDLGGIIWRNGNDNKSYIFSDNFKPIPTEEDKMVDELKRALDKTYGNTNYVRAHHLIRAGYRKVEPISFELFVRIFNANEGNLGDFYSVLKQDKHIIVKDGE